MLELGDVHEADDGAGHAAVVAEEGSPGDEDVAASLLPVDHRGLVGRVQAPRPLAVLIAHAFPAFRREEELVVEAGQVLVRAVAHEGPHGGIGVDGEVVRANEPDAHRRGLGEGPVEREGFVEGSLGPLALRDVDDAGYRARHLAVDSVHRRAREEDEAFLALARQHDRLVARAYPPQARLEACPGLLHRFGSEKVEAVAALERFDRVHVEELRQGGIRVGRHGVERDLPDARGRRLAQGPVALEALGQGHLRLLALRDVEEADEEAVLEGHGADDGHELLAARGEEPALEGLEGPAAGPCRLAPAVLDFLLRRGIRVGPVPDAGRGAKVLHGVAEEGDETAVVPEGLSLAREDGEGQGGLLEEGHEADFVPPRLVLDLPELRDVDQGGEEAALDDARADEVVAV